MLATKVTHYRCTKFKKKYPVCAHSWGTLKPKIIQQVFYWLTFSCTKAWRWMWMKSLMPFINECQSSVDVGQPPLQLASDTLDPAYHAPSTGLRSELFWGRKSAGMNFDVSRCSNTRVSSVIAHCLAGRCKHQINFPQTSVAAVRIGEASKSKKLVVLQIYSVY